jgi:hypothetical protein
MAETFSSACCRQKNRALLVLYRQHQPYHEPLEKLVPAAP